MSYHIYFLDLWPEEEELIYSQTANHSKAQTVKALGPAKFP